MKKGIAILLACILAFSMVACSEKPKDEGTTSNAPVSTADEGDAAPGKGDVSPEEQAMIDAFNAMADSYNATMEKLNADPSVKDLTEVQDIANQVADVLNEVGTQIETQELTADDIANVTALVDNANEFVLQLEAMLANYGGKTVITINVKVTNQTGVEIHGLAMSPDSDDAFGGNLLAAPVAADATVEATMNITEDTLVWDLLAVDSQGNTLEFLGLDFSDVDIEAGAQITLGVTEGGGYAATIQ